MWDHGSVFAFVRNVERASLRIPNNRIEPIDDIQFPARMLRTRYSLERWSNSNKPSWLLIKHRDAFASTVEITEDKPFSVASKRLLVDIARLNGGNITKAATGDPPALALKALKKSLKAHPNSKRSVWHAKGSS